MEPLKVGVLISGRGSNLKALLDDLNGHDAPARVACVIANSHTAGGLAHAEAAGVPSTVIDHRTFQNRESFDGALSAALGIAGVGLVCLAGFMRILGPSFVDKWTGRVINIHPSLLPAYPGLDTQARALEDGATESGCTVHFVTRELDGGPIIAQRRVPIFADDSPQTLAGRVLAQEHQLYPRVVRAIAQGTIRPPRLSGS